MILTKTYRQFTPSYKGNIPQSDLDIIVEYDTETRSVIQIVEVRAINRRKECITDLTAIFNECLNLAQIVDSIDWQEVYTEAMADNLELAG